MKRILTTTELYAFGAGMSAFVAVEGPRSMQGLFVGLGVFLALLVIGRQGKV